MKWYIIFGDKMKVKVIDEDCEKDLETSINAFLSNDVDLIDIKYQVAIAINGEEQLYCFSAMIIYKSWLCVKFSKIIVTNCV